MKDAPHKKEKKKKGKGGKVQQQHPERESYSAVGSGENNYDTECNHIELVVTDFNVLKHFIMI
jgi:hypothetical protein